MPPISRECHEKSRAIEHRRRANHPGSGSASNKVRVLAASGDKKPLLTIRPPIDEFAKFMLTHKQT